MRYTLIVVALLASACGGSSTAPTKTLLARLAVASGPTVGACSGNVCAYTVSVVNNGPDCASGVSVSIASTVGQAGGRIAVEVIQASTPGIIRTGQVVALGGTDWPLAGTSPTVTVRGDGVSCP